MKVYRFWTYMLSNITRTVLYTGITNNLAMRLVEHWIGKDGCFTTRYKGCEKRLDRILESALGILQFRSAR